MRVHDGGNGVVVDVTVALFDKFDGRDTFFFGFVCEHGAECAVADDADVREFGAVLFVDYETAFVVDFEADVFETETGGVRATADSYKNDVRVELEEEFNKGPYGANQSNDGLQSLLYRLLRPRLPA